VIADLFLQDVPLVWIVGLVLHILTLVV